MLSAGVCETYEQDTKVEDGVGEDESVVPCAGETEVDACKRGEGVLRGGSGGMLEGEAEVVRGGGGGWKQLRAYVVDLREKISISHK